MEQATRNGESMTSRKPLPVLVAKWLLFVLVLAGVVYTFWKGISQISDSEISLDSFRWSWLPVAAASYFFSMIICWGYWHLVLKTLEQSPDPWRSFRAYIMGQLGKYFPGKALVVILRTSLISGPRVQPAVAATSVFVETLSYMAVGAGLSSLLMIFFVDVGLWLIGLGLAAIVMAGLPVAPPVFRFLVRLLRLDRLSPRIGQAVERLDARTSLIGWLMLPFSWLLVGLSLWATIQMIGVSAVPIEQLPRLTACAGMAIVIGFLSMMPGGLGVREMVLVAILAPLDPAFDAATTLIVAVTLRMVWLVTELVSTIILKGVSWIAPAASTAPSDRDSGQDPNSEQNPSSAENSREFLQDDSQSR